MKRRVSIGLIGVLLLAGAAPAAAHAAGHEREVLLSEPSLEEFCQLFDAFSFDEFADEFENGFEEFEEFADFEPEPVDADRFPALQDALSELLAEAEDAVLVTAEISELLPDDALVVSLVPDVSQCEAFADIEELDESFPLGAELDPGAYLIQPTVDEFCAVIEEAFEVVEEELDGVEPDDVDLPDPDEIDPELFEEFAPQPVPADEHERFAPIGEELQERIAADDDVAEAAAIFDGEVLLVTLTPSIERCDVDLPAPDDLPDEAVPVDGVAAGFGGGASSNVSLAALVGGLGFLLLIGGGLAVRRNRG